MAGLQSRAVNRAKLGIELMYFCQAWYEIKLVTTQYLQYDCTEGVEWLRITQYKRALGVNVLVTKSCQCVTDLFSKNTNYLVFINCYQCK